MQATELPNRPATIPTNCTIMDFEDGGKYFRVSMKLVDASSGSISIDAQCFEVDANGNFMTAPDGRPSRTAGSVKTVMASSLGDTHTLNPGWVRKVGTYQEADFENAAPTTPPAIGDTYFDTAKQTAFEYVEGEKMRIAKGAVDDMMAIIANSSAIAGIGW
ncbi:hypothetical protein V3390_00090 [Luteimonas sp. FXH3W]|uniref:Uncharacterized protein n=1 Tax=Aquilutibacter rugosus TaxID=3115820 RepID=A0ABU7UVQ4_9GAMM